MDPVCFALLVLLTYILTLLQAPVPNAPPGAPPLPALPTEIPLPHPQTLLDTEKPFKDRLKIVLGEFKDMFSAFAHIWWLPISWILTFVHSGARLWKFVMVRVNLTFFDL